MKVLLSYSNVKTNARNHISQISGRTGVNDTKNMTEGMDKALDRKYTMWRIRAFIGTWLAYAGFYLCRKTIAVAQPEFMKQFGWNEVDVGIILSGYLTAYAIGQFINGALGDKLGSRAMLALGFVTTVLMNLFFGFSYSILIMFFFWTINGYAQSIGWPSVIKGMSNWFSVRERGKVMSPWGTCYSVGDVVGTGLAAFIIGRVAVTTIQPVGGGEAVTYADWRWVFWIAGITLAVIAAIVLLLFKNRPQDVNLPDIAVYHKQTTEVESTEKNIWKNTKDVLRRGPVWILGLTYFGVKFIRYTFMFWTVTYLAREKGMGTELAGYISTIFAMAGILGTLVASYLSDAVFKSRRAPISVLMLLGLTLSLFFFYKAPISLIPVAIGLVGFMTYGPDFVISAVAVMDFGSREGTSTAAGFVNGLGSIGPAIMPIIVGYISASFGWVSVFYLLIALSIACAALMMTLWNKVGEN